MPIRTMRLKAVFLCFTILTIITAAVGLYFYFDAQKTAAFNEDRVISISHLNSIKNSLSQTISHYQGITLSLSRHPELNLLLAQPSLKNLNHANQILDIYNSSLQTSVCYLLNTDGMTIASSNRNDKDSFIGKDYSFRPYFKNSIQGKPFVYTALGVTSGIRGIYFSNPVYDDLERVTGVVAIKEDLRKLETEILTKHYPTHLKHIDLVFIINEVGMILLADNPKQLFHTLWKVDAREIDRIAVSKQLGAALLQHAL